MGWNAAEVKRYVLHQLGHPKRNIELANDNHSEALRRAIRYYGTKKPILKMSFINVLQGVQAYNFSTLSKPFGKGIIQVYREPITKPSQIFSEFEYYRLRQPPYVDMGELLIDLMYYKEIGYLTGVNFDWHWDQASTQLLVTPLPTRSFNLAYEYNDEPAKIDDIPLTDQGWVVDYTLALTKQMLGRVRSKFGGVPGNELPVELDGTELISEGKEEAESLKESLWASRGDWTPPLMG